MLAELRGAPYDLDPLDVGDNPPDEIVVEPQVTARWGAVHDERWRFRFDQVEASEGSHPRAIYVPA